jgi:hypothetical protein
MSSFGRYQLLNSNIDENQQQNEMSKNNYSYFSSSAPTIISRSDLICESKR